MPSVYIAQENISETRLAESWWTSATEIHFPFFWIFPLWFSVKIHFCAVVYFWLNDHNVNVWKFSMCHLNETEDTSNKMKSTFCIKSVKTSHCHLFGCTHNSQNQVTLPCSYATTVLYSLYSSATSTPSLNKGVFKTFKTGFNIV